MAGIPEELKVESIKERSAEKPIRVLLMERHAIVRAGLHMLIQSSPGMEVAGESWTCADAVAAAAREQPDVILLDTDMIDQKSPGFFADLATACPTVCIIILAGSRDLEAKDRAVLLGAQGLVLMEKAAETLVTAIENAYARQPWPEPMVAYANLAEHQDVEATKVASLTPLEREILSSVAGGLNNEGVAKCLSISEADVRAHLASISHKLGVADRFQLIIYAYARSLNRPR